MPKVGQWITLSIQHLFAMFGATVLVPFLVGLSPGGSTGFKRIRNVSILTDYKRSNTCLSRSSSPLSHQLLQAKALGGPEAAMIGMFCSRSDIWDCCIDYQKVGLRWLMNILPPVVVGPVIIVIGLSMLGTAVDMAMYDPQDKYSVTIYNYSADHF